MVDENGARAVFNSNCFMHRNGYAAKYIILHGTGGGSSAQNIASYFASTQNTANPVSAHYIVDTNGFIIQCNNESDGAFANGYISGYSGTAGTNGYGNGFHDSFWDSGINPNFLTIAIEHVKSAGDNSNQLTTAQKQASFTLIQHICSRNNIPQQYADKDGGITGHYAIDPVNRALCPGAYPWEELFQFLSQDGETMLSLQQAAEFFKEVKKDQWYCFKTDNTVEFGILNYYRTCTQIGLNGLSQYGLPLDAETKIPNTNYAVVQHFERGSIIYDPNREVDSVPGLTGDCYPGHIDKGPGLYVQGRIGSKSK